LQSASTDTNDWNASESIRNEFSNGGRFDGYDHQAAPTPVTALCDLIQGPSLAVREQSFRTNLQARALALSKGRSALTSCGSVKSGSTLHPTSTELIGSDGSNESTTESDTDESFAEFARKIEASILQMKTYEFDDLLRGNDTNESPVHEVPPAPKGSTPRSSSRVTTGARVQKVRSVPAEGKAAPGPKAQSTRKDNPRDSKWPKFQKTLSLIKGRRTQSSLIPGRPTPSVRKLKQRRSNSVHSLDLPTQEHGLSQENVRGLAFQLNDEYTDCKVKETEQSGSPSNASFVKHMFSDDGKKREMEQLDVARKVSFMQHEFSAISATNKEKRLDLPSNVKLMRNISTRTRSFHTDGWKEWTTELSDVMTEEVIAAEELKAREAYIGAMHAHQSLLKSGKDENSDDALASQKILQACFANIEHWETVKMDFKANPSALSPRAVQSPAETLSSVKPAHDFAAAHTAIQEQMSGDPQDHLYVGEKELNAREAYIIAMRYHQVLISKKVPLDSPEWIKSQERQQECLATLNYWESLNNEVVLPAFDEIHSAKARPELSKSVYRVSQENKEDRRNGATTIESILVYLRDRFLKATMNATEEKPTKNDGISSKGSDVSKFDNAGWTNPLGALGAILLPLCFDSAWLRDLESVCGSARPMNTSRGKANENVEISKKKAKPITEKAEADRRSYGSDEETHNQTQASSAKMQREVERQAKRILRHLRLNASDDCTEILSRCKPQQQTAPPPASTSQPSKGSSRVVPHPEAAPQQKLKPKSGKKMIADDESDDGQSAISKLVDEQSGGLFCSR
jgi:hypothetical protein